MKNALLFFVCLLLPCCNAFAANMFVETESFTHSGGWALDQQFMDQMGSPYLIAHGMGTPVEDATTPIVLPQTGTYYIYVRTYNWTSPWSQAEGPGRFVLITDNHKSGILGASGNAWQWQSAGQITVRHTKITLRLHDLTGFDGRCDAIYLTTDKGDVPPAEGKALKTFRRRQMCLPDIAPLAGQYDMVVVGAGIAGISAAASAARLGCRVALINDRPIVGGNNSSDVRVHLGGRIEVGKYPALGGLQKEFGPIHGGNAQPAANYEDQKKLDWLSKEPNIKLFLNYHVTAAHKEGNHLVDVTATQVRTGKEMRFSAPLFADCTGDGTIGFLSGADYRMGRESRSEFGESIAPENADSMTMGASVQWYSVDNKAPCRFPEFHYGITFDARHCEKVQMGEWTWETGMNLNQITDFERIRDYGMLVVYSNWSFLKNHLKNDATYRNLRLGWVAYVAGKRESRRLLGDYILKEDDICKNVTHEDASFTTTWTIDLHFPDKTNATLFPGNAFKASTNHIPIYPYSVPYRCLYSRNVANLFMAGRDISVTHVALGTTRVMRTTGMMGEVVGMAASLCHKYNVNPRDIYLYHLKELKQLMTVGVGGEGLPNNQRYNEGASLQKMPEIK